MSWRPKRPSRDGRHVDLGRARLEGVGAGLDAGEETHRLTPTTEEVWRRPAAEAPAEDGTTYYDRPVIKEPVWIWTVPLYFYLGGASGTSAVLGLVAQSADREGFHELVRRARWVAALGGAFGTGCLIYDLGRPERFLHMLRVFRPTSPMSVGSWLLAAASANTMGAAVAGELAGQEPGPWRILGDAAAVAAAILGLPLAGYPAVLLSNTAVPVWQEGRKSLPLLFLAASMSGSGSLLETMELPAAQERTVQVYAAAGKAAELATMHLYERDVQKIERVGRPLERGVAGWLWNAAKVASGVSLALTLWPGRSKGRRVAAGVLGTLGTLAIRYAVSHAGKGSARDPRATFEQQRRGHGGEEATGRPAVAGPEELAEAAE